MKWDVARILVVGMLSVLLLAGWVINDTLGYDGLELLLLSMLLFNICHVFLDLYLHKSHNYSSKLEKEGDK